MRCLKSVFILTTGICTLLLLFSGCGGQVEKKEIVLNPLSDPNVILPGYASEVFEAAGGREAWSVTNLIKADCVVTFSKSDGSRYITEHHYELRSWPGQIRVSAMEPGGMVDFKLTQKGLETSQGKIPDYLFTQKLDLGQYGRAVLEIITAPMRLFDRNLVRAPETGTIKVEGDLYRSIVTKPSGSLGRAPESTFFQEQQKRLVDMIWYRQGAGDLTTAVKGYEYREFGRGVLLPAKIDIYKIDSAGISRGLIARIELYNIRCEQ